VLDAKDILEYSIKEHFTLILLSLNYEDLCEHQKKYCLEKLNTSGVLNSILRKYPDNPCLSKSPEQCRDKLTAGYFKLGKWLWRLAAPLGLGNLVLADDKLLRIIYVFLF
jgi:hypothetical protein